MPPTEQFKKFSHQENVQWTEEGILRIQQPTVLGETFEELVETLRMLAEANVALLMQPEVFVACLDRSNFSAADIFPDHRLARRKAAVTAPPRKAQVWDLPRCTLHLAGSRFWAEEGD